MTVANYTLIARRLPAIAAGNPRDAIAAVTASPGLTAGENGSAQLRRCAGGRDRSAEAIRPGRRRAGTGMPDHPRQVLAAAVAARRNAADAARRPYSPHR